MLGAVIMLGTFFWDDLGSTGRKLVAVASLAVPALGGAALIMGRARSELGKILLALACYAAGFAYLVVFEDQEFVISAALVVLTSAVGAVLLRSGAFLVRAGRAPCCWSVLSCSTSSTLQNPAQSRRAGRLRRQCRCT